MKTGIFFCTCGTNISEKIDPEVIRAAFSGHPDVAFFSVVGFLCSEEGKKAITEQLLQSRPDRVVFAACSPRDHEETFRKVLISVGMNPYLFHMVNIREHVAWVVQDKDEACRKTIHYLESAIRRVQWHKPLEKKTLEVESAVLVLGGGTAGLKVAHTLAQAGRKVVLVEKTPVLGGLPVRFEETFPNLECAPCMLEPLLGEVLHGPDAGNIEVLTCSELADAKGFFGNFMVKILKKPRFVDTHTCIGCGECARVCPQSSPNEFNCHLNEKKAIDFPFFGGLPNAPFIDMPFCARSKGEDCHLCVEACPVPEAITFGETEELIERNVGAIVVAVGGSLFDPHRIPELGYGKVKDVYTTLEFERILAGNGPRQGELVTAQGKKPESVGIIHCVGSLDKNHKKYCSEICCQSAFKFNHMISHKLPTAAITHFYKVIAVPGKEEFELYNKATANPKSRFVHFDNIKDLTVSEGVDGPCVEHVDFCGNLEKANFDMVILCPALEANPNTGKLQALLELSSDKQGFLEELHGRVDAGKSKIRGIYMAGACQAPMNIGKAMSQAVAAAGYVLSELATGKIIEVEPITASIDAEKCSGCKSCISVCPYRAITFNQEKEIAEINSVLCQGCGTCVSTCPSACITGNHFSNEQIMAEMEGMVSES
jgi:heterodisulfide reductase subunit A